MELDPTSPTPRSNIAAAYFELGQYKAAIKACDAVLSLFDVDDAASPSVQKLLLRKTKACIHTLQLAEARKTLSQLDKHQEKGALEKTIQNHESNSQEVPDQKEVHRKLIFDAPRFRPQL